MKNIIFIAAPGAGKGTQSKLVSKEFNIPHISTGDLLRDELESGSMLGKMIKDDMNNGKLISDDVIVNLLRTRLNKVDCNNGYILDGFPRNVLQAKVYKDLLLELGKDEGVVIYMDIDKELAMNRTMDRLTCTACGCSYSSSIDELKPRIEGICDRCGHALTIRDDDNKKTFLNRFDTYLRETNPLIEYYDNLGILKRLKVESSDSAQDVFNKIRDIINN